MKNLELARKEELRWRILVALQAGSPIPVLETILFRALHDAELLPTPLELRREIDYLEKAGLVQVTRTGFGWPWSVELTQQGIECVEGSRPCPPGVNPPPSV